MFSTLYTRLKAKTPKFFKRVIIYAASVGTMGGALAAAGDTIPAKLHDISKYMITVGIVGAGVAGFAKEDHPEQKPE